MKFKLSSTCVDGVSKLAQILGELSKQTCDVTVVGNMACKAIMMESSSLVDCNMIESASVVWEFFKGRKLPGIMALDRVCSLNISFSIHFW